MRWGQTAAGRYLHVNYVPDEEGDGIFVVTAYEIQGKPLRALSEEEEEATMNEKVSRFPAGWDADRVKRLIDYYENMSEDEQVAEDEAAAAEQKGQAVITVPEELLPAIRRLLAAHKSA